MLSLTDVLKSGWHFLVPIFFLVIALIYPESGRDAGEGRGRRDRHPDRVRADLRLSRQACLAETDRSGGDRVRPCVARHHPDRRRRRYHGRDHEHLRPRLRHDDAASDVRGDNVFWLLLLIAILAFVLGIGLPTVSVYILTATLLAPALIKLGVTPMAAHMFVMYNGMLSMITPPVAFAAYAAANIAKTDGWTTGWIGMRGRLEYLHPAIPVRTDPEPPDGRPELSDRVELRTHPVRAVRRHGRNRRLCADTAVARTTPALRFRRAADRVAAGELHRRLHHQPHRHRRRHRIAGVRPPEAAAQEGADGRTRLGIRSSRARCRALPAPAGRRSRTAPTPSWRCGSTSSRTG